MKHAPSRGFVEDSPSLRQETEGLIRKQTRSAARLAGDDLELHAKSATAIEARLGGEGFTVEQVIGDWFPHDTE